MGPDTATVIQDALALDVDQRAVVANALPNSIHDPDDEPSEIDDAWRVEVDRRLDEMRSGAVKMIDADEHFARLRTSLTDGRR
ncbi:MAG: addiction module protein [Acidipropionibacterium sp.]|jgi:putative addiction module component (TIGR02574 family)|nr:addiction module protein [Acidipropionibacterium sp.]